MPEPAEVALTEAQRELDEQLKALETMRTRSTTILSAALIVVGLFGTKWTSAEWPSTRLTCGVLAVATLAAMTVFVARIQSKAQLFAGADLDEVLSALNSDQADDLTSNDVALSVCAAYIDGLAVNERHLYAAGRWMSVQVYLLAVLVLFSGLAAFA